MVLPGSESETMVLPGSESDTMVLPGSESNQLLFSARQSGSFLGPRSGWGRPRRHNVAMTQLRPATTQPRPAMT